MSGTGAVCRQFLGLAVSSVCLFSANCALSQITPDRTLPNNTTVTINGSTFNITGGTQAGRNLFHSFQQFSVPANNTALFNNGSDVQNIFSRVTGGSVSDIQGTIRALGTANLFFLNPNGIVFGRNASLNVGGSFVATTANAIQFGNLGFFSASAPNNPALLTINPTALFYNQIIPSASIQNSSIASAGKDPAGFDAVGLRVPDGKSLLLAGGNINLDGGGLTANGGRVELAGLAAPGTIDLNVAGDTLSLSAPSNVQRGNVSLTNQAFVDVSGAGGGDIAVNAGNLEMSNSYLFAGIGTGLSSFSRTGDINVNADSIALVNGAQIANVTFGQGNAGNVIINATKSLSLDNGYIFSTVGDGSSTQNNIVKGNGGNIEITTNQLSLLNGAALVASTYAQGNAGNITIRARDAVTFDRLSQAFSGVGSGAVGNGGNINLLAGSFVLSNGAQLTASTSGKGDAGNININIIDNVFLAGTNSGYPSGIFSSVDSGALGKGGNLNLITGRLLVRDGAQISASTFGLGNSGNITFNTVDTVELIGTSADGRLASGIRAAVESGARGNAGNLTINTGRLVVRDGAQISASTFGFGNSGNIRFNTVSLVELIGTSADGQFASGIRSAVESGGVGNAGNLTIDTGRLLALNGAQVSAATFGQGSAGDLTFRASDSVELVGTSADGRFASGVRSAVEASAVGNGGNSTFLTNRLLVQDGAEISTASSGKGNAGNLNVRANFITLNNQGKLIANSVTGEGGNVSLRVNDILLLRRNSLISNTNGTAQVGGNGGNFFLSTQFLVAPLLNNSDIITNAFNGRGGKIDITASDGVFGFDVRSQQDLARLRPSDLDPRQLSTNDISAISQNNPTIITPDADPSRGLILLPTVTEKPPKLVSSNCTAFNETAGGNNFTITGRGGLPKSPYEPLTSDAVWSDTRLPLTTAHQNQPKKQAALIKPKPIEIVPATGWVFNGKGEVTLISSVSNTTSSTPMSCAAR